jgi:hypothetical protein
MLCLLVRSDGRCLESSQMYMMNCQERFRSCRTVQRSFASQVDITLKTLPIHLTLVTPKANLGSDHAEPVF